MIAWMSDETSRIIDDNHLEVYGFDNDEMKDAIVSVCKYDTWYYLHLGDIRRLPPEEIDHRCRKALLKTEGLVDDVSDEWMNQGREVA